MISQALAVNLQCQVVICRYDYVIFKNDFVISKTDFANLTGMAFA